MTFKSQTIFTKSRYVTKVYIKTYNYMDSVYVRYCGEITFSPTQNEYVFNPRFFGLTKFPCATLYNIAKEINRLNNNYKGEQQ